MVNMEGKSLTTRTLILSLVVTKSFGLNNILVLQPNSLPTSYYYINKGRL